MGGIFREKRGAFYFRGPFYCRRVYEKWGFFKLNSPNRYILAAFLILILATVKIIVWYFRKGKKYDFITGFVKEYILIRLFYLFYHILCVCVFNRYSESVMGTRDGRFTRRSMSTHLKRSLTSFRWVDIDPIVNCSSRVPIKDSFSSTKSTSILLKILRVPDESHPSLLAFILHGYRGRNTSNGSGI